MRSITRTVRGHKNLALNIPSLRRAREIFQLKVFPMGEIAEQQSLTKTADKIFQPHIEGQKLPVSLTINGAKHVLTLEPWTSLLDALREQLNLTGTKKGCDHGQCGACTILVDGKRINSCLTLAIMFQGASVTTIEGISEGGRLHEMQQAFIDHDAFQCGYCTPGQICSAIGMLAEGHAKNRDDIYELMSGNLCRCAAYSNICDAIELVSEKNNNPAAS